MSIAPIEFNYKQIRNERQKYNNNCVFEAIKEKNMEKFYEKVNLKELERVLEETDLNLETIIEECSKNDIMNKIISGRISKKSSRQGSKDEDTQLSVCKDTASKFGISINSLSATAYRPQKNGNIISNKEMKKNKISKDDCLKSFDAKISGKINGWIFAKNVFGNGGHQDNVFEEADSLCKWVVDFRTNQDVIYVIMIDTDLEDKLEIIQTKYNKYDNILVKNHVEFQQYLIDNYSINK